MANKTVDKLITSLYPIVTLLGVVLIVMGLVSTRSLAMGIGFLMVVLGGGGWYISD